MKFIFFLRSASCRELFLTSCWWPEFYFLFFQSFSDPVSHTACAHLFTVTPFEHKHCFRYERTRYGLEVPSLCCDATSIQASARGRELEQWQHRECAKTLSWLCWQSRIRGRSCHEQSLLHMAERIPEGTRRRQQTISLQNANSCGIRTCVNAESRGSGRVVASGDDHEMRLDDD